MITTDEFLKKCNNIHSDKYLYEKVKYVGNRIDVITTNALTAKSLRTARITIIRA